MSNPCNTVNQNQQTFQFDDQQRVWLFGYGSLIYKVDFPFIEKRQASIRGWSRRFWQGSHDHRGTITNPGRVVTLIESPEAVCGGIAFLIEASVFQQLDVREQNGYLRFKTPMTFIDGEKDEGLVYIATTENDAFLGRASDDAIARQMMSASGNSGDNTEYLLKLAASLRELSIEDSHVFALEKRILELTQPL